MHRTVLTLYGAWGEAARDAVSRALEGVLGVRSVSVDIYQAEAVVEHDGRCTPADLEAAVSAAGKGWYFVKAARGNASAKHQRPEGG